MTTEEMKAYDGLTQRYNKIKSAKLIGNSMMLGVQSAFKIYNINKFLSRL